MSYNYTSICLSLDISDKTGKIQNRQRKRQKDKERVEEGGHKAQDAEKNVEGDRDRLRLKE